MRQNMACSGYPPARRAPLVDTGPIQSSHFILPVSLVSVSPVHHHGLRSRLYVQRSKASPMLISRRRYLNGGSKVCIIGIIEPGGFDSNWRGSSMNILPQHPAYSDPDSASSRFRSMLEIVPMIEDTNRMAKVLFKLADEPELPLRLQLEL